VVCGNTFIMKVSGQYPAVHHLIAHPDMRRINFTSSTGVALDF
jgi:acyl-CoA reductase-like NAD-dependent aldehyde dehydrogenase